MQEVSEAALRVESDPEPRRASAPVWLPPSPRLEALWDVWVEPAITSHRRWVGAPVVAAKRALRAALRPYGVELLRRQRDFNRATADELNELRRAVASLSREVAELRSRNR